MGAPFPGEVFDFLLLAMGNIDSFRQISDLEKLVGFFVCFFPRKINLVMSSILSFNY